MQISRDYYNNINIPEYILCKANRERIGIIPCTEKTVDLNFGDLNELSIKTYYMIDGEINPVYNDIEVMKYILVPRVGFFYIQTCNIQSEGSEHEYKDITARSYEGLLGQKYLENFLINTGETGSKELEYDDTGKTPIYIWLHPSQKVMGKMDLFDYVLEKCPDWYVSYVDPILLEEGRSHRSFNIDRQDVYSFLMNDVQEAFECYIEFDTIHLDNKGRCGISIYAQENYKYDTNIFVSYDNLLANTNIASDTDDIKTCVTLKGKDELEIREINFGYDRLYNFDYYNNTKFWSQKLYDEYNEWHDKVYTVGNIERSEKVYTEDLTDEELSNMSYLDLYQLRLKAYLNAKKELDDVTVLTSSFVNDDEREIGSGKFPVINSAGEEIGSISFETDTGVRVTESLPSQPYNGELNYIYIIKDATVNISNIKQKITKIESGKNITTITHSPIPSISVKDADYLGTDYSNLFDYNTKFDSGKMIKILNCNALISKVQHEINQLKDYIRTFDEKKYRNYHYKYEEEKLDYKKYNDNRIRVERLRRFLYEGYFVVWQEIAPDYVIPNSVATNLINLNSTYSNLLIPNYSSSQYKIRDLGLYKNQLSIDSNNQKHLLEVGASTSKVTYPGYQICRWFDNTETIKFHDSLVSANDSYSSTGTISIADATSLREHNPLYNSCLIIGSDYVEITQIDDFEEYLKEDLAEQTALLEIFPTSAWFNTNQWDGYGYSELKDTWALSVDQILTVMSKKNWGTVPEAYKDVEIDEADFSCAATSKSDEKDPYNYFGNYLPAYLTQLAIESKIKALNDQMNGYDVYPYPLISKGSIFFENLPTQGMVKGDTYSISNDFTFNGKKYPAGTNVTWNGTRWVITQNIITHVNGIQDIIEQNSKYKEQVVEEIALDNNLSEKSRVELSAFIREEELTSDNYLVTDVMSEEERQEMLQSFLEYGQKELSKVCIPQLNFTADIGNLYSIPEFDEISEDFEPGKTIFVSLRDDYYIKATLLNVHMNYYDPTDFTMTFSDIMKKSEGLYTDLQDAINTATDAATSVAIGSSTWTAGSAIASRIDTTLEQGLLSQGAYLSDNPAQSTFTISDTGIFVDTASGDYGKFDVFGEEKFVYDSIYIGGGRILFTDDGWKHVRMSLGRSQVTRISPNNPNGVTTEEFGVFADFVISGYVAGSQICGGTLYSDHFTTDENGNIVPVSNWDLNTGKIAIYKTTGNEEAVLKFNGSKLSIRGSIEANDGVIGGFNITTNSLYSNKPSLTDNNNGVYIGTDGISLGPNSTFKVLPDGSLYATKGTFSGTITASTININNKFVVDPNGNVTANGTLTATNANISGTISSSNATLSGGSIAGWNFNSQSLYSGLISLNSATASIYIGNTTLRNITAAHGRVNFLDIIGDVNFSGDLFFEQGFVSDSTSYLNKIYTNNVEPNADNTYVCGTAENAWIRCRSYNFITKTASSTSSDRKLKTDIKPLDEKYEELFFKLRPTSYRFKDGERTHIGAIAQEVEQAVSDCGLTSMDFAGYTVESKLDPENDEADTSNLSDEEKNYYLRYPEFVMLNTHMIQKAYKRIEELEKEVQRLKG